MNLSRCEEIGFADYRAAARVVREI